MTDDLPADAPRPLDRLLAVVFALLLTAPAVVGVLRADAVEAEIAKEYRKPAAFPAWPDDADQLSRFPARVQSWFDDHFGFRTRLIRWHNMLKLFVFGVSPSDRYVLGAEGWQFIGAPDYVANYRGTRPFTREELLAWREALQVKRAWLARQGIEYLFLVAPSKSTIYPERMPAELTKVGEQTRCDQLLAELREHSDVEVIDIRPALLRAKAEGDRLLYYPLGSHWNDLGAYVAAREIALALRRLWFPDLVLDPLGAYELRERHGQGGDSVAGRLHLDDLLTQDSVRLLRKRPPFFEVVELGRDDGQVLTFDNPDRTLPRAVLLRDSFGTALAPLLAPYFSRLVCLWQWYMPQPDVLEAIRRTQPDVVIDVVVERLLIQVDPPRPYDS